MKKRKAKNGNAQSGNVPIFVSVAIIIILVGCYFLLPSFRESVQEAFHVIKNNDQKTAKKWVQKFGIVGPVVIVAAFVAQMFTFVVPNVVLMLLSITIYGPVWGSLLALLGVFCSSSIGYVLGRNIAPVTIHKFISPKTQKSISEFIHDYGVPAIAITRLSSLSNDSLSIIAGLLRMTYWKYILATLSGILPLIVLLAIYGDNGKIEKALIIIGAVSLAGLIVYIVKDKRKQKKKRK